MANLSLCFHVFGVGFFVLLRRNDENVKSRTSFVHTRKSCGKTSFIHAKRNAAKRNAARSCKAKCYFVTNDPQRGCYQNLHVECSSKKRGSHGGNGMPTTSRWHHNYISFVNGLVHRGPRFLLFFRGTVVAFLAPLPIVDPSNQGTHSFRRNAHRPATAVSSTHQLPGIRSVPQNCNQTNKKQNKSSCFCICCFCNACTEEESNPINQINTHTKISKNTHTRNWCSKKSRLRHHGNHCPS
jgi:hypothetical protein